MAAWLAITFIEQESIIVNRDGSRDRAYWEFFLNNHPAPSWKVVAIALWRTADYRALEIVMKLYFKCKFIITETGDLLCSFPTALAASRLHYEPPCIMILLLRRIMTYIVMYPHIKDSCMAATVGGELRWNNNN